MSNARPLLFCAAVAISTLMDPASAQTPQDLKALPDVPPPPKLSDKPVPADADDAPSITIRQEGENKVEEFRTKGGRVYAVRVTPRIGKPYLLVDPDGKATVPNTMELNGGTRPAQWTLFEF
jgi:hypothetical protein